MPRTKKTLLPKNLLDYEVYEEDTSANSQYFGVLNLPQVFTGGRNSFYLDGSDYLKNGSSLIIEILDVNNNTVYFSARTDYVEGTAVLVSIEVYDTTPIGIGKLIIMGEIDQTIDGFGIPDEWQNTYNTRWIKNIMIEPRLNNKSPIKFKNSPEVIATEKQFYNIATSSITTENLYFSASFKPLYENLEHIGYLIEAQAPTTFSAELLNGIITGSVNISSSLANSTETASINIFVDEILNYTTSFATNASIKTDKNTLIEKIYLESGSYSSSVLSTGDDIISSSVVWTYKKFNNIGKTVPISYADLRITNLSTLSGEIYKAKIYAKPASVTGEYKLVADTPLVISELLVTESSTQSIGFTPIGDFAKYPSASTAWYASELTQSSDSNQSIYPVSGSPEYYVPIQPTNINVNVSSKVLLDSMMAEVQVDNASQKFSGSVSQSGYFIGTIQPVELVPTTEYTLQLDAYYKKESGSVSLTGNTAKVDIYIIGASGSRLIDEDPLGQKIGTLSEITGQLQRYFKDVQLNFTPQLIEQGPVGLRLVVSNGFWNFANVSIVPSSDTRFSPDESTLLIPNTEFHNQFLQYKVEFFDINNNSVSVIAESVPSFFTGSSIDLGNII